VKTLSQTLVAFGPPITPEEEVIRIAVKEISDDPTSPAGPEKEPPYLIYGIDETQRIIWGRKLSTQQLVEVPVTTSSNSLFKLKSDFDYWLTRFPNTKGDNINATKGMAAIMKEAEEKGVFSPGDLRGRGTYLDEGRVVFNRGDVLVVDGQITPFSDLETKYAYIRRDPLTINLDVPELGDDEGQAVLDVVASMGWAETEHPLYVAGFVVTSVVCGALPNRPVLQTSSAYSTGKTALNKEVIIPLQAGIGIPVTNPTHAGLRQQLNSDARPIWIDESENESPQMRQQHLELARYCYDGLPTCRGGQWGKPIIYQLRSSLSVSGINATIPNPADRSRIVSVRRQHLPPEVWGAVSERLKQVITHQTGERLFRRVLNNVNSLLANIEVFKQAIQARLPHGVPTRYCDTYGTILAGAHLLLSTRRLTVEEAGQWLQEQGWAYRPDPDAGENPALQESTDCLEYLLSSSPWGQGSTVRVLVEQLKGSEVQAATRVSQLGQFGLKVDRAGGLVVANRGKVTEIFKGTRWADAAHKERLKELPGAAVPDNAVRFKDGGSYRCVLIPWSALDLDSDHTDPQEE
jgi:putative DNA primase/helicase